MVPFMILLLVLVLVVLPIWAIVQMSALGSKNETLERKLDLLDAELKRLRAQIAGTPKSSEPSAANVSAPAESPSARRDFSLPSAALTAAPDTLAPQLAA